MPPRAVFAALLSLIAAPVGGCRIVDQRTFERAGLYPAPTQLAAGDVASRASPPLVVIRFGNPGASWRAALIAASRDARARKPDVVFDVVAPVPLSAPITEQDVIARTGAADSAEVATALQSDGVAPDRIRIGSRGDPGNPPRQVEVFVR